MTDMERPLRVAIVDPDARALERARSILASAHGGIEVVSTASRREDLTGTSSVDVIVVDVTTESSPTEAVRDAIARWPNATIVAGAANVAPSHLSRAVAAGARAFVVKPYAADDLVLAVRDAHDSRRRAPGERRRRPRGRIIAVYSPKGGVGSTTIATNVAVALARGGQARVALCDLDLQFGDVGSVLDVRSANSVLDLVSHAGPLDEAVIAETFTRHISGVDVLLAPEDLSAVERVDPVAIAAVVEKLRSHFDHVVCDTWSSLDQLSTALLDGADDVVIVTTPELPSVRDVHRALDQLGATGDRAHIVINRAPGKSSLGLADVEAALGRRALASIPSDGEGVTRAINRGVSLFHGPGLRIARHYRELADALVADAAAAAGGPVKVAPGAAVAS